jgi:hypothetical protein
MRRVLTGGEGECRPKIGYLQAGFLADLPAAGIRGRFHGLDPAARQHEVFFAGFPAADKQGRFFPEKDRPCGVSADSVHAQSPCMTSIVRIWAAAVGREAGLFCI